MALRPCLNSGDVSYLSQPLLSGTDLPASDSAAERPQGRLLDPNPGHSRIPLMALPSAFSGSGCRLSWPAVLGWALSSDGLLPRLGDGPSCLLVKIFAWRWQPESKVTGGWGGVGLAALTAPLLLYGVIPPPGRMGLNPSCLSPFGWQLEHTTIL